MALAERTWERVGERKRDRARLIESAVVVMMMEMMVVVMMVVVMVMADDVSHCLRQFVFSVQKGNNLFYLIF